MRCTPAITDADALVRRHGGAGARAGARRRPLAPRLGAADRPRPPGPRVGGGLAGRHAAQHALGASESETLERATREAVALETAVAERPEAHLNLGNLYMRQGRVKEAEDELNIALRLDPRNVPALVNLADLCRATGREADAERLLEERRSASPRMPPTSCTRSACLHPDAAAWQKAMAALKRAYELRPGDAATATRTPSASTRKGKTAEAVKVLAAVQRARPADRDVLVGPRPVRGEARRVGSAAIGWAQKLVALRPEDAEARALLSQVQGAGAAARRADGRRRSHEPIPIPRRSVLGAPRGGRGRRCGHRRPGGDPRPVVRAERQLRSAVHGQGRTARVVRRRPHVRAPTGACSSSATARAFRAVSAVCTHLGCTVRPEAVEEADPADPDRRRQVQTYFFACPCHGSRYRADGANVSGPAPRPLAAYRLTLAPDDGQLVVDLCGTRWREPSR